MKRRKERKLIIVSASSRLREKPTEPIQTIERCDGIFFRVLRKFLRDGKLRKFDILIVSEKYGLLSHKDRISYYRDPYGQNWRNNVDDKVWLEFKSYVLKKHKILREKLTSALEAYLKQAK